jgi:hypothetical protein
VNTKEKLNIPTRFLLHTLRKPELYDTIALKPSHYILTINPYEKLNSDMTRYVSLGEKLGMDKESNTLVKETQKRKIPWYSYTNLLAKNPRIFGNVFIIDKLRVNTANLMAHYTSEKVTAGGSFHVLSVASDDNAKILALWYNSMVHLFLFLFAGRAIQGAYYRALISDLKKLPILDVSKVDKKSRQRLVRLFDKYSSTKFPPFPKQIEDRTREEIDLAILQALEANNPEKTMKSIYKYVYDRIGKLKAETNRK